MNELKFVIGKWNDDENYVIYDPIWVRILNIVSEYHDTGDVRNVMKRISDRGIANERRFSYIACYGVLENVECFERLGNVGLLTVNELAEIKSLNIESKDLQEYTIKILCATQAPERIIEEFRREG